MASNMRNTLTITKPMTLLCVKHPVLNLDAGAYRCGVSVAYKSQCAIKLSIMFIQEANGASIYVVRDISEVVVAFSLENLVKSHVHNVACVSNHVAALVWLFLQQVGLFETNTSLA